MKVPGRDMIDPTSLFVLRLRKKRKAISLYCRALIEVRLYCMYWLFGRDVKVKEISRGWLTDAELT